MTVVCFAIYWDQFLLIYVYYFFAFPYPRVGGKKRAKTKQNKKENKQEGYLFQPKLPP